MACIFLTFNIQCTKMKFSIKDFFSKYDQIHSFQRIWWHLLKKSLLENLFLCSGWCFPQWGNFTITWYHQTNLLCKLQQTFYTIVLGSHFCKQTTLICCCNINLWSRWIPVYWILKTINCFRILCLSFIKYIYHLSVVLNFLCFVIPVFNFLNFLYFLFFWIC